MLVFFFILWFEICFSSCKNCYIRVLETHISFTTWISTNHLFKRRCLYLKAAKTMNPSQKKFRTHTVSVHKLHIGNYVQLVNILVKQCDPGDFLTWATNTEIFKVNLNTLWFFFFSCEPPHNKWKIQKFSLIQNIIFQFNIKQILFFNFCLAIQNTIY